MKKMKELQKSNAAPPDDIPLNAPLEDNLPELLPPSDDRVFKVLLTHADADTVLKSVVTALLGRKVLKVTVRNNEIPVGDVEEKQSRLDVNCVADEGEQIDIEMQASHIGEMKDSHHANLKSKCLFYLCDLHSSQGIKGKHYDSLAHTWQVTFCAYTVFPGNDRFFHIWRMRDEEGRLLSEDITLAFVELPKAARLLRKPVEAMSLLEAWTVFFGYANRPEYRKIIDMICRRHEEVEMARTLLQSISKDERERAIFRSRRMYETDMESNFNTAIDRGRKEGKKEGAKQKAEEIARAMLAEGSHIEFIVKVTKLTPAAINKLSKKKTG